MASIIRFLNSDFKDFEIVNNGAMDILLGIIATLASLAMFLQPLPTFWRVCKKKDIGGLLPYPYVISTVNSFLWYGYALPQTGTTIQFRDFCTCCSIMVGGIMGSIYTYIFWNCCELYRFPWFQFGMCLTYLSPFLMPSSWLTSLVMENRDNILGPLVIVVGTILYATPIFNVINAVRRKRVEYLPIRVLVISCLNAFAWMIYACLPPKFDLCLLITHGFGTVFTIAQLGIAYEIQSFLSMCGSGKRTTKGSVNDDEDKSAYTPLLDGSDSDERNGKDSSFPSFTGGASFFGGEMERELEAKFKEFGLSEVMSYALASYFGGFHAALYVEKNMSKMIYDLRFENGELQQVNDKLDLSNAMLRESADKSHVKLKEFLEAVGKKNEEVQIRSKEFLEALEEKGNEVKIKLKEFLEAVGIEGDLELMIE